MRKANGKISSFLRRVLNIIIRISAAILTFSICVTAIGGCIVGSLTVFDVFQKNGADYYARLCERISDLSKGVLISAHSVAPSDDSTWISMTNELNTLIEQIWSWGDNRPELYSQRHGSVQMLKNGNMIGSFEHYNKKTGQRTAHGIEVDAHGDVVWECLRTSTSGSMDYSEYRLTRMDIYTDMANTPDIGLPAKVYGKGITSDEQNECSISTEPTDTPKA